MDMAKYRGILDAINPAIKKFNSMLNGFSFPLLDASKPDSCFAITDVLGKGPEFWPGGGPGVYVLLASYPSDPKRIAAYVGKTSFTTTLDRRYKSICREYRVNGCYARKHPRSGEKFFIDAVAVGPVAVGERGRLWRFMASALEEFIIDGVQNKEDEFVLLNKVGVER